MTTYHYKCDACQHEFDIKQRMTDDSLEICPECMVVGLKRVIQPTEVIYKGDGWFRNQSKGTWHGKGN